MADLIDREKTKAAFEPWLNVKGYSEGELNIIRAVLYEITIMPSAQPDVPDTNVGDMISRQAAIDALGERLQANGYSNVALVSELNRSIGYLRQLPSVEAEPVRQTAEWIYGEKDGADGWYCSKCGFHIPWYYEYYGLNNINFIRDFHTCPHCDSKMMKYTGMDEVT